MTTQVAEPQAPLTKPKWVVQDIPTKDRKTKVLDVIEMHKGEKVAVICARYQYRGIVSEVLADGFILSQATAVETSGASSRQQPEREDPIGSSVVIMYDAIEIFYTPSWCKFPLPGDDGYPEEESE